MFEFDCACNMLQNSNVQLYMRTGTIHTLLFLKHIAAPTNNLFKAVSNWNKFITVHGFSPYSTKLFFFQCTHSCEWLLLCWRSLRKGFFVIKMLLPRAPPPPVWLSHGLNNYTVTEAKFRHLKKLTCKGTSRQVFIRVCRLEIQSVMLVFSTQLCELLPSPLLSGSTLSHPPRTQKKIQNPCYQIRYCTNVISTGAILVSFCLQQHALLSQSMR